MSALLAACLPALAQESAGAAKSEIRNPKSEILAIVGADVWTVTKGVIKGGTVIVKGAKIDKVGGSDVSIPQGATVVEAKGKVLAPGLVIPSTGGGFGAGGGFVRNGGGRLKDALDPYALPVNLALATGVTSVYAAGGGGGLGGGEEAGGAGGLQSNNAVLKMTAEDMADMLLKEPANLNFSASGGGRRGGGFGRFSGGGGGGQLTARYNLRDLLSRTKDYQDKLTAYEKGGKKGTAPRKPAGVDDALALVKKERILRITAGEVSDIRWALSLVDEFGIREIITPATEAWVIADEIAKRNTPGSPPSVQLIITARSRVPSDARMNRANGSNPDAAGILYKAGVPFAVVPPTASFSTGGELGRDLLTYPLEADYAIRGGMDEKTAFEALTILPAQMLGVADRIGSIEEGKDADLVIFSRDPLDYRSFAEKTFVNGKLLYEQDKSTFFSYVRDRAAGQEK